MTRDELLERLKYILVNGPSMEDDHIHADRALLEYINDAEITKAYDAIEKWYS